MHNLVLDENWFEGSKEFYPWEAKNFIRGKAVRGTAARSECQYHNISPFAIKDN